MNDFNGDTINLPQSFNKVVKVRKRENEIFYSVDSFVFDLLVWIFYGVEISKMTLNKKWQEIKALCDKATPGPWYLGKASEYDGDHFRAIVIDVKQELYTYCSEIAHTRGNPKQIKKDATFIAASRTELPKAIALIEKLSEALEVFANQENYGRNAEGRQTWPNPRIAQEALKELEDGNDEA